jgi:hypothetical protein
MKRDEIRCRPGEEKTRAVTSNAVPTSVTEIRQFMALCNFFRKFIINFSIIAEPLHVLIRKAVFGRMTTDVEERYHSYELENLAVVESLERFKYYLVGHHFKLVTDCNSLVSTLKKKELVPHIAR